MKTLILLTVAIAFGLLSVIHLAPVAHAQDSISQKSFTTGGTDFVALPPIVFQAAGPTATSIQSAVDAYRDKLGANNGNKEGQPSGRREINWDGGSPTNLTITKAESPFRGFQATRGALFTTPDGIGFVQAPPSGLAEFFNNPKYANIFTAFSPSRLFSAIGGTITDVNFFVPGGNTPITTNIPATVSGFGAVFTDVDQSDSTLIEYFGTNGELLFSSFVPASPGDGNQSFFGIVFPDARIARVRITSGNVAPGADDIGKQDIVMMDDFIYSEPQPLR